jgi:hypothetical protein
MPAVGLAGIGGHRRCLPLAGRRLLFRPAVGRRSSTRRSRPILTVGRWPRTAPNTISGRASSAAAAAFSTLARTPRRSTLSGKREGPAQRREHRARPCPQGRYVKEATFDTHLSCQAVTGSPWTDKKSPREQGLGGGANGFNGKQARMAALSRPQRSLLRPLRNLRSFDCLLPG